MTDDQEVEITDEALLPAEFRRTTVTLDQQTWEKIIAALDTLAHGGIKMALTMAVSAGKTEQKKAEIARVLKSTEPCFRCGGSGKIVSPIQLAETLEDYDACKGSGQRPKGVPGAVLKSGVRLVVS